MDGIPETLPPVTETAERPNFDGTEPRPANPRRRHLPALQAMNDDEQLEDDSDTRERHVLDDLL